MSAQHPLTTKRRSVTRRAAMACVVGALVASGCNAADAGSDESVNRNDELRDRYRAAVIECVHDRGFADYQGEFTEAELAEGAPVVGAASACDEEVSARPEFNAFQSEAGGDEEEYAQRVAEGWAVWKCVEEAGYTRISPIPLTAPNGRPLLPTIRNFDVDENDSDMATFYGTAAQCGDGNIERYRFNGRFLGMDDILACNEENIGVAGYDDVTGCYNIDEYPASS